MEIRLHTLISLCRPGSVHCSSVSWDDPGRVFPDELHVSSIPDRFPHCACGIVRLLWLHWVKDVCMSRCNLPPILLAEWPGSFTCHCSTTGVEWTLNKSQYTKLTLERKILLPLLLRFEFATFCILSIMRKILPPLSAEICSRNLAIMRKVLLPLLLRVELATFQAWVWRSANN